MCHIQPVTGEQQRQTVNEVQKYIFLMWQNKKRETQQPESDARCHCKCSLNFPPVNSKSIKKPAPAMAAMLIDSVALEAGLVWQPAFCDACFLCALRSLGHVMQLRFLLAASGGRRSGWWHHYGEWWSVWQRLLSPLAGGVNRLSSLSAELRLLPRG